MLFIDKPMAVGGDKFYIQSPNGFSANDRVIAIDMKGNCELTRVTAVVPGDHLGVVTSGIVEISHPAVAHFTFPGAPPTVRGSSTWGRSARRPARSTTW